MNKDDEASIVLSARHNCDAPSHQVDVDPRRRAPPRSDVAAPFRDIPRRSSKSPPKNKKKSSKKKKADAAAAAPPGDSGAPASPRDFSLAAIEERAYKNRYEDVLVQRDRPC